MSDNVSKNVSEKLVFVVDDNKDFLESTLWMLEGVGYEAKGFEDTNAALDAFSEIDNSTPCCVLMDVRMPGMSGLDVHDAMNARAIHLPVVYMTGHGDVPLAVEAMKKGALTFLEKPLQDEALESALQRAFSTEVQLNRGIKQPQSEIDQFKKKVGDLSDRERQILELVLEGQTNMNIGHELNISIKTVELHRSRAVKKLGVRTFPQLVKMMVACRT